MLGTSSGGVVRHVVQLASEVAALVGANTPVRVAGPADHAELFKRFPYAQVQIGARPSIRDVANTRLLRRSIRGNSVAHAHGLRAGAQTVLAAKSLARSRRPRVVVTLHNVAVGSRSTRAISRALEWVVARGADEVLGVSSDIVTSVQGMGAAKASRALIPAPGGFAEATRSAEQVREDLGLDRTTKVLLTVGRLAPQKGLDTLLDAAQLLQGCGKRRNDDGVVDFVWLVAGPGPRHAELAHRIEGAQLPVQLLGARADVPDLLAAADVFVSTAVWEGQPIGIQEALHASAAIVATDAGGTSEVTGATGAVIVPVSDAAALSAGISTLLDDDAARRRQRIAAQQRAQQLPGPAEMAQQVLRAYGWLKFLS